MKETKQKLQAAAPGIFDGTPALFAYLYGSYVKALVHPSIEQDLEDIMDFKKVVAEKFFNNRKPE
jgi:hypothetical protein